MQSLLFGGVSWCPPGSRFAAPAYQQVAPAARALFLDIESARVKLFGRRPHEGRATGTGAGVRKAAEDETARWGEGWRHTPRYGDLNTDCLCVEPTRPMVLPCGSFADRSGEMGRSVS